MTSAIYNLYHKDRTHPFLFCKDYTAKMDASMKKLITQKIIFFASIGESEIFDKIVNNTDIKYKYIKVGDEFIGVVYPKYVTVNDIVCISNSFIDFNTRGSILVEFDLVVGKTKFVYCVAHFYNYGDERMTEMDGVDILMTTYDPVI
jgi:hypothetical protein